MSVTYYIPSSARFYNVSGADVWVRRGGQWERSEKTAYEVELAGELVPAPTEAPRCLSGRDYVNGVALLRCKLPQGHADRLHESTFVRWT